ncbi:MAG: tRNA 2-selenouridine(34) synthase MnmH, partial [Rhodobacteraceae bacterium]|nr:tRNA 2-selenouridine(34) synthase MnmH [Paracoccaceae bacterium]
MPTTLTSLAELARLPFDDIIDVRSPAEFAEDHVPGAISLPVLSNEERAQVGTLYKQVDPFVARKVGAALVSRNAANHLEGPLADRKGAWRPLVYCWRGGQRSGSFASILAQIGWRADTVKGGYKAFRALVVDVMHDSPLPFRLIPIDGMTGTAKTALLHRIAAKGGQVIDLEGAANHRGSLFGAMGEQPSQKMFETRVAMAFAGFDLAKPVFVESEAAKVGDLLVPPSVWKALSAAPRLYIEAAPAERAAYLAEAYADVTSDAVRLSETLDALVTYHGRETIAAWQALA